MNQSATIKKAEAVPSPLSGEAMKDIRKALARACAFVNVEPPVIDGDVVSNRIKTPFDVTFSFKFETANRFVNGDVNAGNVPVVSHGRVAALKADLRDRMLTQFVSDDILRARTIKGDLKGAKMFQTDYAVCKDTCTSCSGAGQFQCSPCGGVGVDDCTWCFRSGHEDCVACGGRGGTGNIICVYCNGKGRKPCHKCNATLSVRCGTCGGNGTQRCGGCGGCGIVSTIHSATFSCNTETEVGPTAVSADQLTWLKLWAAAGFSKNRSGLVDGDGGNFETDVVSAAVIRLGSDLEYKVSFNCFSTVNRIEFEYEGKKAWVEHAKNQFLADIRFSTFLEGKMKPVLAAASSAALPSGIRKALKDAGYAKVAACFEKPDILDSSAKLETKGAITSKSISTLAEIYNDATHAFARRARRRAWKVPVVLALGGWWLACRYDIPQSAAESHLWMASLAFVAGLITLVASNLEARMAIAFEANTVRGWWAGPAGWTCAVAAAALFWTSSYYGFRI
ncbi:hypothetical protein HFO56_24540 [Rhizobium laguerreae]|uniref:hypothetical protein n=1 Tax=Rhizobium laguerreae TaxID=1076926 RepID=UPI001C90D210|nr:hypothetical protein [Rhizobium laguerreae]MBY3155499.1 hypothetical protein [Rhizobium laguerreae]